MNHRLHPVWPPAIGLYPCQGGPRSDSEQYLTNATYLVFLKEV